MSRKWLFYAALCTFCFAGCDDETNGAPVVMGACGNGVIEQGEVCDDGNALGGDGCAADCSVVESGFACPGIGGACRPIVEPNNGENNGENNNNQEQTSLCGNGQIDEGEVCDDGNTTSDDGCSSDCKAAEDGFDCSQVEGKTVCHKKSVCGDGEITDAEVCDDRNTDDGDGCAADCTAIEENYTCPVPGEICIPNGCGNEIVEEETETCDDGLLNVEYGSGPGQCSTSCREAPYCGDGNIDKQHGEECDSGSTDKSNDYEGCSSECKHVNYCGDGIVQSEHEKCDDGNLNSGDGCSSTCTMEEGYICVTDGGKSVCTLITCGNGEIDGSETCDDGNRVADDGCSAICQLEKGYAYVEGEDGKKVLTRICGDGVLQDLDTGKACSESSKNCEACDDGNLDSGDGCSNVCTVEAGYICPDAGKSCVARSCGDGIVAKGEECDDGVNKEKGVPVSGDGCSDRCKIEPGYHCSKPGSPCEAGKCGDGFLDGGETCDEGSSKSNGGCVDCRIQNGWKCEEAGKACVATTCGDGKVEGLETCEEKSEGCVDCQIQTGYHCDDNGKNCVKGKCGDGKLDVGEACDDGNQKAGDGCSPLCTIEEIFECVDDVCRPICGDGLTLWEAGEECDDGNLISGDGCSSQCKIETGFYCTDFSKKDLPKITVPITYYDFRGWAETGTGDGYATQAIVNLNPSCFQINRGHPDFENGNGGLALGIVKDQLSSDGKPVWSGNSGNNTVHCTEAFDMWYRYTPGMNQMFKENLTLTQVGGPGSNKYVYEDGNFFPLTNRGYGNYSANRNFGFTSEFSTYFKFEGGEKLDFYGDDDVWVFVNGRLAVDIGGVHGQQSGSVTLNTTTHSGGDQWVEKFNIFKGGIYPIKLFQAERHTTASNYKLTLTGFVNMGASTCNAKCGDGIIAGTEECDYKTDDLENVEQQHANGCNHCKLAPWCGNGKIESGEGCEYDESSNKDWCNPDCTIKTCGDGKKDANEQCDGEDGVTAGQVCLPTCRISGCGDGYLDTSIGEECDDGNTSNDDACTTLCKAPYCGDGVVTPSIGEVCDDGEENNDGAYGHCGIGCGYAPPRCGDGVIDTVEGEECDDGTDNNVGGYGRCKPDCKRDIYCGDGTVQEEFEQCDKGDQNGKGECTESCSFGVN